MTNIKLVALDMDGTLLDDKEMISEYTQNVIMEAENQGVKVILCTGRPLHRCYEYAEKLELSSNIICVNGAEIWTMGRQLIERHTMDANDIKYLWKLGDKKKIHMWLVAVEETFVNGERPDNFHKYSWLKMGYGNLDDQLKQYLLDELANKKGLEVTNSSYTNIEVNKINVNKLNAIESVCHLMGITKEEVMAVGDSLNDLKMIEQVGIGVAVKNAQQTIIDAADYITASNNDDGVGKAIEKFVLHR